MYIYTCICTKTSWIGKSRSRIRFSSLSIFNKNCTHSVSCSLVVRSNSSRIVAAAVSAAAAAPAAALDANASCSSSLRTASFKSEHSRRLLSSSSLSSS